MYLKLNKLLFTSYLFVGQMSEPRRQTDGGHFCFFFIQMHLIKGFTEDMLC